jgi:hypothetical protein
MAYLNKDQYDYRRESAAKRGADSSEVAVNNGMTEEQAELIVELCSLRHEFHCNIGRMGISDNTDIKDNLIRINGKIKESGIDYMKFIPTDKSDYIDIDTIDLLIEIGEDIPEDDIERGEWREKELERIYEELYVLHDKIESYIKDIDKKYNTNFAPTGALRI